MSSVHTASVPSEFTNSQLPNTVHSKEAFLSKLQYRTTSPSRSIAEVFGTSEYLNVTELQLGTLLPEPKRIKNLTMPFTLCEDNRLLVHGEKLGHYVGSNILSKINVSPHDVVIIRLHQVVLCVDFVLEFISTLYSQHQNKHFVFSEGDKWTKFALHTALKGFNKVGIALDTLTDTEISYIGMPIPDNKIDVLKILQASKAGLTSDQITKDSGFGRGDTSNRLGFLEQHNLIKRFGKWRSTFVYFHPYREYCPDAKVSDLKFNCYDSSTAFTRR